MSQFFIDTNAIPGSSINTLSAEGGAATPPSGTNFNFAGNSGLETGGAIEFATPSDGQMTAQVRVDGVTITINGSNQLTTAGSVTGSATTNGAQTVTILTISTTANTTTTFNVLVAGFMTLTGVGTIVGVGGTLTGTFISGPATTSPMNFPDAVINTIVTTTANIIATASGLDILIQVVGDASYDINWKATLSSISAP